MALCFFGRKLRKRSLEWMGWGDNETDGRFYARPKSATRSQAKAETTAEARREGENMGLFQITKKPIQLKKEMEKGGGLKLTPFFFSSLFFLLTKKVWGCWGQILQRIIKKVHLMKHMDTWHIFWHPLNSSTPKVRFCGFQVPLLHMEVLNFLSPLIDIILCRLNFWNIVVNTFPPAAMLR